MKGKWKYKASNLKFMERGRAIRYLNCPFPIFNVRKGAEE